MLANQEPHHCYYGTEREEFREKSVSYGRGQTALHGPITAKRQRLKSARNNASPFFALFVDWRDWKINWLVGDRQAGSMGMEKFQIWLMFHNHKKQATPDNEYNNS